MKKITLLLLLAIPALFYACGVSRQISEAKALGDCKYNIVSADSMLVAGYDVREFKSIRKMEDINPLKYPRLAAGLLTRNIPFSTRINLEITNPTLKTAALNQLEYRVLLAGKEFANGFINQRIEVPSAGGKTVIPVHLKTNAYDLVTDPSTRDAFTNVLRNLSGDKSSTPTKVTIKIKPTIDMLNKAVNYPGYITIEQELTSNMLVGGN
ncbi:LEA type 2 family protein [Fibrella sp. HMF5335]|uniref:LEA type 2 family protein n=1 Tax=Fibrella rubiginis TaxID=2817060 RepID=A0A939GDX2_9BACT|nr:LEA type 2 family protein [Fibrella rubiginis]MBO0934926.1 LEA type 2 family protein [Fibrella rubiginis]